MFFWEGHVAVHTSLPIQPIVAELSLKLADQLFVAPLHKLHSCVCVVVQSRQRKSTKDFADSPENNNDIFHHQFLSSASKEKNARHYHDVLV